MKGVAKGTFEVSLKSEPISKVAASSGVGRMSIDKRFTGDLVGTSKGEMLSSMGGIKESAGYVAIERVTATIGAKSGSFSLQHCGSMNRGTPTLSVSVIPDSGTEALSGIEGTLSIDVAEGKHSYTFNYSLPE